MVVRLSISLLNPKEVDIFTETEKLTLSAYFKNNVVKLLRQPVNKSQENPQSTERKLLLFRKITEECTHASPPHVHGWKYVEANEYEYIVTDILAIFKNSSQKAPSLELNPAVFTFIPKGIAILITLTLTLSRNSAISGDF